MLTYKKSSFSAYCIGELFKKNNHCCYWYESRAGPEKHIKKRIKTASLIFWQCVSRFCPLLDTMGQILSFDSPAFNPQKDSHSSFLNSRRTLCFFSPAFLNASYQDHNGLTDPRRLHPSGFSSVSFTDKHTHHPRSRLYLFFCLFLLKRFNVHQQ